MTPIRAAIVDDEPLALERLSDLLAQIPEVQIVGQFLGGREAITKIPELEPDIVFLDVEMPGLDGFDVVEGLSRPELADGRTPPLICFVTAYPGFAANAFESGALDYLCKPVRLTRLETTLARARSAIAQREAEGRLEELSSLLEVLRDVRNDDSDRLLWIHQRGEAVRLEISSIDWLNAEGECVRLHVGDKSYLHRSSISSICNRLSTNGFIRIHRSFAVNGARLKSVRRTRSGVTVLLASGIELPVGRTYRSAMHAIVID